MATLIVGIFAVIIVGATAAFAYVVYSSASNDRTAKLVRS